MKFVILFLLLQFSLLGVFSQQQVPLNEKKFVDSLQNIIDNSGVDSAKATACFSLVEYWKVKDTSKSWSYLRKGKEFAAKHPYYKALVLFYEGQYYFNGDKNKASAAFRKAAEALAAFPEKRAYSNRAAAWFNYALMNKDTKGYDFVTKITLENAIPNAEKADNPVMVAYYYTQLSTILMNNYQFTKAGLYCRMAIDILEKENSRSPNLLFAYLSGVSIHCYDHQTDTAKKLLQKAHALLAPFPESINYPLYYANEALYYITTEAFGKALSSIDKGMSLAGKYHQTQLYQQFLFRKYEVYDHQKAYGKAKQILLDIVKEGTLTANSNDKAAIFAELAKISEKLHDYKEAYTWLARYRDVSDSIHNSQTEVKVSELETKYRSAQNQQKIAALEAKNKQASLAARNDRLYRWMLGLGCLLLLTILGFVAVTSRNNRNLSRQKEINFQQQLIEMGQKQQIKVTKAMLEGEEHERERVARDLHDGLGGMLAGVKIGLSSWSNTRPAISQDSDLHRIIKQLDSSISELRRIARNMVPDTLLKFGLEVALKDLCEFYMRDGLHISFEPFHLEQHMALNVQLSIYRIIQELISNAIKHAQANNIILQCSQNANTFFITLEDDGIGFDTALLAKKKGMGLDNLKNRITFLQGHLEIISAANVGTTVNIELNTNGNE